MLSFILRNNEFDTDPQKQKRSDEFEERNVHDRDGKSNQDHTQEDGTARSVKHSFKTEARIKVSAGKSDHNCVVTAEQDVDQNNLKNGHPMNFGKPSDKRFQWNIS